MSYNLASVFSFKTFYPVLRLQQWDVVMLQLITKESRQLSDLGQSDDTYQSSPVAPVQSQTHKLSNPQCSTMKCESHETMAKAQ